MARKRTPIAVTEDSGPVLSFEREAAKTAVDAEATRPVESAEGSTSQQSHAGMPAAAGEEQREPQGAAPNPPKKRCDAAGEGGLKDQLFCRNPELKYEEF
jgi:hypothetical protein